MAATKAALASGGMTHCCFRCGLRVFFSASARSCCRWPVRRSSVRRPPLPTVAMSSVRGRLGGLEQANAINLASAAPSKIRRLAEFAECLRIRAASNPSSTSRWRVLATVATLVSSAAAISLSLQPSPPSEVSAFNRMRAFSSFCAGCFPLWIRALSFSRSVSLSVTMYFFTALSLLPTSPLRRW